MRFLSKIVLGFIIAINILGCASTNEKLKVQLLTIEAEIVTSVESKPLP